MNDNHANRVIKVSFNEISLLIDDLLTFKNDVILTISGNSMYPLLKHNRDQVVLTSIKDYKFKKYDLPLYKRSNGQYVLHKIVGFNQQGLILKGDNQIINEYGIKNEQVIAIAKGIYRKSKYLSLSSFRYRLYCYFWSTILPLRVVYYYSRRIIKKIFKLLKRS